MIIFHPKLAATSRLTGRTRTWRTVSISLVPKITSVAKMLEIQYHWFVWPKSMSDILIVLVHFYSESSTTLESKGQKDLQTKPYNKPQRDNGTWHLLSTIASSDKSGLAWKHGTPLKDMRLYHHFTHENCHELVEGAYLTTRHLVWPNDFPYFGSPDISE